MFDAIVLAGGRSRRLDGADKPALDIGGVTLLDRVIAATSGAERVIVVGPQRATHGQVRWTQEDPPGGGPVAALAAAIEDVAANWCLVLAADLPAVEPAVALLLTAATDYDVAVLTRGGRRNHLAAVWRTDTLREALAALDPVDGAAVRELFVGVDVTEVADEGDWGADCDTWDDVEAARARVSNA